MIIQPALPGGFVIFCDDVREEVNGKQTLVGTYGGEMTVFGTAPAVVPSLAVVVRYREDPENLPKTVTFKILKFAGGNENTLVEAVIEAPQLPSEFKFPETSDAQSKRFVELQFAAKISPLEVAGDFQLKVRAYYGDDEVRLGALNVKLAPLPDSSQPT